MPATKTTIFKTASDGNSTSKVPMLELIKLCVAPSDTPKNLVSLESVAQ